MTNAIEIAIRAFNPLCKAKNEKKPSDLHSPRLNNHRVVSKMWLTCEKNVKDMEKDLC